MTYVCYIILVFIICDPVTKLPDNRSEQHEIEDVLSDMEGCLLIDDVGLTGTISGVEVLDLNLATMSSDIMSRVLPYRDDLDFRKALLEKCLKKESCLEAYVVLNTLYPQHAFHIAANRFAPNGNDSPIPVKVLSDSTLHIAYLSFRDFGNICREYWRHKLGVKSEAEIIFEEMERTQKGKKRD